MVKSILKFFHKQMFPIILALIVVVLCHAWIDAKHKG